MWKSIECSIGMLAGHPDKWSNIVWQYCWIRRTLIEDSVGVLIGQPESWQHIDLWSCRIRWTLTEYKEAIVCWTLNAILSEGAVGLSRYLHNIHMVYVMLSLTPNPILYSSGVRSGGHWYNVWYMCSHVSLIGYLILSGSGIKLGGHWLNIQLECSIVSLQVDAILVAIWSDQADTDGIFSRSTHWSAWEWIQYWLAGVSK